MWQSLRADAQTYRALTYPDGGHWLGRKLIWVTAPGLVVLTMQRVTRRFVEAKRAKGWTLETILLRIALAGLHQFSILVAKSDVLEDVEIGAGVLLSNLGNLVIGAQRIGAGTHIHHRVTIGMSLMDGGKPAIGNNVWIGPDCVIYGSIEIGDGATILPGTVLTKSIPANTVVQGNPARVLRRDFDNIAWRRSHAWNHDSVIDGPAVAS